jgi:hypothetical protein
MKREDEKREKTFDAAHSHVFTFHVFTHCLLCDLCVSAVRPEFSGSNERGRPPPSKAEDARVR